MRYNNEYRVLFISYLYSFGIITPIVLFSFIKINESLFGLLLELLEPNVYTSMRLNEIAL